MSSALRPVRGKAAAAEIAGLAGDGLPNPEIAAPLFIGRRLSSTCCAKS
jgi:hypothetical protein